MGILRSPQDGYINEMAKWEHRDVAVNDTLIRAIPFAGGGKGGAPFAEFPKAMYRAEPGDGGYQIAGYKQVGSEGEEAIARGQGWHLTQEDAMAGAEARQQELARLAANRAHTEKWMSEGARREAQAVDEATMQHVPVIPETPIRKGGKQ